MKRFHKLRAVKSVSFPRRVIYYDSETEQLTLPSGSIQQRPFLVCAQFVDYDNKTQIEERSFHDCLEFWKWVISKTEVNRKLYLIAHNQDFDFRACKGFSHLRALGYFIHKLIVDYPRFIVTLGNWDKPRPDKDGKKPKQDTSNRRTIYALDSLNWFRESLAKLGETIGAPKFPMPEAKASKEDWIKYCMNDVTILRLAVEHYIQFLRENELGNFGCTLASQAMNAFKAKFMQHEIFIHAHEGAIELERQSYFGGRTECFFIGTANKDLYFKVDINSMYPYLMRNNVFPTKMLTYRNIITKQQLELLSKKYIYIANIIVDNHTRAIPKRFNAKLCFPTGLFSTTLCKPELDLLDSMNIKYKIQSIAFYESAPIFKEYVDWMYEKRLQFRNEGNEQYQYFCKLLMNSLYGKFGQRNTTWDSIGHDGTFESDVTTIIDHESKENFRIKKINGELFKEGELQEGYDSFVAIASFVTSYSRAYLYRLITVAGENHCFYMDTDSLIVDRVGMRRLEPFLDNKELGKLKVEAHDVKLTIHNLKDYEFAGEIKIKGVSRKAKPLGDNRFEVEQWEHFNGALMRGRLETVLVHKSLKTLQREYLKGVVQANGRTTPFIMRDYTQISL